MVVVTGNNATGSENHQIPCNGASPKAMKMILRVLNRLSITWQRRWHISSVNNKITYSLFSVGNSIIKKHGTNYLIWIGWSDILFLPLLRVWESISVVTCCRSLVIVYDSRCVLQIGFAAASSSSEGEAVVVDASKLMQGSLYQGVLKSGSRK